MSDAPHGSYALRGGRSCRLERLLLTPTYQGALEGSPARISRAVRERLDIDVPRALGSPAPVVAIDGGQAELPPYRWAAAFTSPTGVGRADDPDYESRLTLCWFTTTIPGDLHAMIAGALAAVDWDAHAEDYDIMP